MLSIDQLTALDRSLSSERVLSVYLDGGTRDPAAQGAWRVQLEQSLKDLRSWLSGSPHDERDMFERCVRLLEGELAGMTRGVGAPGWAAFITSSGVRDAELLPVSVPTLAVWSSGICIAPYIRALKESRPVIVAVVDARHSSIYRYRWGQVEHVETIRAVHPKAPASHMGALPRQGFHTGTRGRTGRDEAQRELEEGTSRMLAEAAKHMVRVAGADGWVAVGGIPRVADELARELEPLVVDRLECLESLDVHATPAEVSAAARDVAVRLRGEFDSRRIEYIRGDGAAHGLGAIGPEATRAALEQSRVRELYLTLRYLEDDLAEAEQLARMALSQRAAIEAVSGRAAEALDAHGGVAALLRYRLPTNEEEAVGGD